MIFYTALQLPNSLFATVQIGSSRPNAAALDDYHSATGKTVEEGQKLVEAGFEFVCNFEDVRLFRKRK